MIITDMIVIIQGVPVAGMITIPVVRWIVMMKNVTVTPGNTTGGVTIVPIITTITTTTPVIPGLIIWDGAYHTLTTMMISSYISAPIMTGRPTGPVPGGGICTGPMTISASAFRQIIINAEHGFPDTGEPFMTRWNTWIPGAEFATGR